MMTLKKSSSARCSRDNPSRHLETTSLKHLIIFLFLYIEKSKNQRGHRKSSILSELRVSKSSVKDMSTG